VLLDFDGTLSPIVPDPADAQPIEGVPQLLAALGARYLVVAVISGRPARFLEDRLDRPPGVRLIGLYGLEEVGAAAGPTVDASELVRWEPIMTGLADQAERDAPDGVSIERKGLGFTLHYRGAPGCEGWVLGFAEEARRHDGVLLQRARMATELRPGIDVDKGLVAQALATGCVAACCFGDDFGDLATFSAMDRLAHDGGYVVRVAVRDAETPAALIEAADLVVDGPDGAVEMLRMLAAPQDP
jgi:trehalose 6-phosphate phosphatase